VEPSEETHMSLVNQRVRLNPKAVAQAAQPDSNEQTSLVVRENMALINAETKSASSVFLQRTFQGLQQMLGQTAPMVAIEVSLSEPLLGFLSDWSFRAAVALQWDTKER